MSIASIDNRPSPDAPAPPSRAAARWLAAWHASPHGPFPLGNNALQPQLDRALPSCAASDQAFRMVLHLSLPQPPPAQLRFRFSNALGSSPLRLAHVTVARHVSSAHVDVSSERHVTFGGCDTLLLDPGAECSSDGVALPWLCAVCCRVSVTFAVQGSCHAITWHAKAMVTSYIAPPGSGCPPPAAGDEFFIFPCTSWFFLSGVDAWDSGARDVVAVLGDSITDGTNSTINGSDKWPDILCRFVNKQSQQLQETFTYVINCGIGGNSICHSPSLDICPPRGGAAASARLLTEVLLLQGLTCCIWAQGINDFRINPETSDTSASSVTVIGSVVAALAAARASAPNVTFIGCTVASALGSTCSGHGGAEQDAERRLFNRWLLGGAAPFDYIIDFDAVMCLLAPCNVWRRAALSAPCSRAISC
jgi:hypothetical protein